MTGFESDVEVLQAIDYLNLLHDQHLLTKDEVRDAIGRIVEVNQGSAVALVWAVRLDTNPV